jgi:hypothetical protein
VVAKDGTQAEAWKGKYVYSNPEHTKQDETRGDRDDVRETIKLATHAERAILILPLLEGEDTERHIENEGGQIIFEAPAGTWASAPDAPGRRKGNNKTEWLTVRIGVILFQSNRDRESEWTPNELENHIRMWWASQAPAQACNDYLTETGAQGAGTYEWPWWPHELMWWRGDRNRSEQAWGTWGTGRDSREAKESWKQCALWQEELGAMGFAPPRLKRVLQGLGASKEAAGKAVNRMEEMSRKTYHQLWRERCAGQHKAEGMRGITPRMKSDRDLREGAKTYREAQKEARGKHAEHNPEHDMGTEDTDQRNQDAVETPEPNAATHTPPYDDEEMELANEQERHHEANNPQPHQAQNPRDDDPLEGNPERMTEADTILYLVDLLQSGYSQEEAHKALATSTRELLAIAVANARAERVLWGPNKLDDDRDFGSASDIENVLSSGVESFWYATFSTLMCVMVRPFVMSLTSCVSPPLNFNSKL